MVEPSGPPCCGALAVVGVAAGDDDPGEDELDACLEEDGFALPSELAFVRDS